MTEPTAPESRPSAARRVLAMARKLLIIAGITLVLCIPLEFAVRAFLPALDSPLRRSFLIDTKRDRTPYTSFGNPPYNGPRPGAKAPGEYRVVMLGGSTVEHGEPAIPALLETELQAHGLPEARVFNYGVVASNSGQQLARLAFDVSELQPDLVVMYDGANDLINPFLGDPRPGYPFDFLVWERNPLLNDDLSAYPALALFTYGSAIARRLAPGWFTTKFSGVEALRAKVGFKTRAWSEELGRAYVRNHVKAAKVARGLGAEFIGFFQPLAYYKEPRAPKEERMLDDKTESVAIGREAVLAEYRAVKARGEVHEKQLVDLSDAFDGVADEVFWNSIHHHQQFRPPLAQRIRASILELRAARAAEAVPAEGSAEVPKGP